MRVEAEYTKEVISADPQHVQCIIPGPPDAPEIWTRSVSNSEFVIEQSKFIAERAVAEAGADRSAQVQRVFQLLLARAPDAEELAASLEADLSLVCRSLINSNEFAFLP